MRIKRYIRTAFVAVAVLPVALLLLQTATGGSIAVFKTKIAAQVSFALILIGGVGAYITQRLMMSNDAYAFERRNRRRSHE